MARQELVEKARTEYGITNADQISDSQLEAMIADIDAQPATDDHYVAPKKKAAPAKAAAKKEEKPKRRRISLRRRK